MCLQVAFISKGTDYVLGSPYRTPISRTILKLQEAGELHMLKLKWWTQKRGGGVCAVRKDIQTKSL